MLKLQGAPWCLSRFFSPYANTHMGLVYWPIPDTTVEESEGIRLDINITHFCLPL